MPRPIFACISRSALSHNLEVVRRRLDAARPAGDSAKVWAVVKANAYGHGIERAVAGFRGADGLAMLDLAEAVRCREAGWQGPILLLEGIFEASDLEVVGRYGLTLAVHHADQLAWLAQAKAPRPIDVFAKLNTGMNRLGFTPAAYAGAYARLVELQRRGVLGQVGHMTHFSTADTEEGIAAQLDVFRRTTAGLPGPASLCNSAASLRYPEVAAAWARPGIALYGASPFADESAESLGLRPAMALKSRLIATQDLRAGDAVGYGGRYRAEGAMRIGVVACGYADGYPRHAPTGTPIVVAGVRTRLLGTVSMDMLAVDLTPVPHAQVGAPVTLWGDHGLSVDEVAAASGTIGYELLCALAPRVPVHFQE
ncbi:alanine racemase [Pigmentiphaga sp.]|uniref:alanine racemase n=1 Tax=Pigmentiphaga sp. TaxID=1977564 RepID=UPI0025F5EB84|nr:alanine racemase [Pigmentiphaga sp.]MBX6318265.1 alanine racemase [Pigmentiphaga sp.]